MSELYELISSITPINPNRSEVVVYLCTKCGALVGDMALHDAHHARERAGVLPGPIG